MTELATPSPPRDPVLVACAHGTADLEGQQAVHQLRARIAALAPEAEVVEASVDVQRPALAEVVAELSSRGRRSVVVPLLLSAGYHVFTDIAEVVAGSRGLAVAAGALGPDDALVRLLDLRLRERGVPAGVPVVLAAAGSSDPRAEADVERIASALQALRGSDVVVGYLSAAEPRLESVVAERLAVRQEPLVIATYLLAPGYFFDRIATVAGSAARVVTRPLAPDDLVARIAVHRYRTAVAGVAPQS